MPLSKTGRKVLRSMRKTYGEKKAKQVFYSMEHTHPEWTSRGGRRTLREGLRRRRRHAKSS